MTDVNTPGVQPEQPNGRPDKRDQFRQNCRGRGGRRALLVVALIGSFFAGGILFSHIHAIGDEPHMPVWMHHAAWMGGPGGEGLRPGGPPPPPMTPEEQVSHARDMVDHALTSVDATADQKTKVLAIFDTTANALKDAPVVVFTTRLQLATLLTAPTIDHAKLEELRAARVADIDNASKTIVKAISDAADVLTQDQRTRLVMMMDHMRHGPPPPPPHG